MFKAFVLGVVQGLTEFIPVSSSGHEYFVARVFGWEDPSLFFVVAVHTGTLISAILYFRDDLRDMLSSLAGRGGGHYTDYWRKVFISLLIASLPAGIAGIFLEGQMERVIAAAPMLAVGFFLGGSYMAAFDRIKQRPFPSLEMNEINWRGSIAIGISQALALLPGVSRSGMTISTCRMYGLSGDESARFSFILMIPAVAAATLYQALSLPHIELNVLAEGIVGLAAAAIAGYFAIGFMIRFLKNYGMMRFAVYCILAGIVSTFFI